MRGGKRPGAGRPPGAQNKKTLETAEAIEASGMTPLDYMITVMRDKSVEPAMRLDAAKGAAPYVHARLNSTEIFNGDAPPRPEAEIREDIKAFIEQNSDFKQFLAGLLIDNTNPAAAESKPG